MEKLDPKAVWIFFFRFLGIGLVLMIMLISIGVIFMAYAEKVLWWMIGLFFIIWFGLLGLSWIWAKLSYNAYRYQLTEDTFRKEYGVIWKKYISIPYERIQNVDIHRGILARILGLSDLMIQTAGYAATGLRREPEGQLPGLSKEKAEEIREELIKRARGTKPGL